MINDLEKCIYEILENNHATLLSKKITVKSKKHMFKMQNGLIFFMSPQSLIKIGFPQKLGLNIKKRNRLEEMKNIAELNNGKLLSVEWKGIKKKYKFELSNGRIFETHYQTIIKRWPNLTDSHLKTANEKLNEIKKIAESRGGKLLSKIWKGYDKYYDFIDANKIKFSLSVQSLKNGSWTPNRGLVTEPLCIQAFDHLFQEKFIKTRKVLTKKLCQTKLALELDGYCEKLKIAFEYQGHTSHWHVNDPNYKTVSERDKLKEKICKELGIKLIIIKKIDFKEHGFNSKIFLNIIIRIILESYKIWDEEAPLLNKSSFKINHTKINHNLKKFNELKELAKVNNIKILSKEWKGAHEKYKFQYCDGRIFEITATKVISNGFPKDMENYLKTDEDRLNEIKDLANKNNIKLLSTIWTGYQSSYLFEFNDGTQFHKTMTALNERGFPKNSQKFIKNYLCQIKPKEDFLNELKNIAKKNEGKLISTKWITNKTRYEFETKNGLRFKIKAEALRIRGWPKNEYLYLRTDEEHLNELRVIAQKSNIKFLETKWLGIFSKYLCEFPDGRQFSISADNIKRRGFPKNADRYFKVLESRKK